MGGPVVLRQALGCMPVCYSLTMWLCCWSSYQYQYVVYSPCVLSLILLEDVSCIAIAKLASASCIYFSAVVMVWWSCMALPFSTTYACMFSEPDGEPYQLLEAWQPAGEAERETGLWKHLKVLNPSRTVCLCTCGRCIFAYRQWRRCFSSQLRFSRQEGFPAHFSSLFLWLNKNARTRYPLPSFLSKPRFDLASES